MTSIVFGSAFAAAVWFGYWLCRKVEPAPCGITMLMRDYRPLSLEMVALILSKEAGVTMETVASGAKPSGKNWVRGSGGHYFTIQLGDTQYVLSSSNTRYIRGKAWDKLQSDPLLREDALHHSAWISMHVVANDVVDPEAYRLIGKVLARLVGPECVALYHPPMRKLARVDTQTISLLRATQPVHALFGERADRVA